MLEKDKEIKLSLLSVIKKALGFIKKDTKLFFKPVKGLFNLFKCINDNKFEKMIKLMDAIEDIKINNENDVMIEFKNSMVIKTNGHQVYYTKEGRIISSASMISDNPEFNLNPYIDKLNINALAKRDHEVYIFYMTKYIDFSKLKFRVNKEIKC